MAVDTLAIVGTLAGVIAGGLVNYVATRSAKHWEWRLAIDKELLMLRNKAYVDFLTEYDEQSARLMAADFPTPDERHRLTSKLNAMAFCGGTKSVVIAENLKKKLHSGANHEGPGLLELRDDFLATATLDLSMMTRTLPTE